MHKGIVKGKKRAFAVYSRIKQVDSAGGMKYDIHIPLGVMNEHVSFF